MGNEVVALEYEAYAVVAVGVPVAILEVLGRAPVDEQVAVRVTVQAAHDIEQGGLTASRGTQDGYEFILAKVNADSVQSSYGVVGYVIDFLDAFQLKQVFSPPILSGIAAIFS